MRCASHTLQLSVLDALKHRKLFQSINNVQVSVIELGKRLQSSLTNIQTKPPRIDCVTRWGSTTCYMIY